MAGLKPSEVRARVIREHDELRALLVELEATASTARSDPRRLCERAVAFHARLFEHLRLEEQILAPALLEADIWGEERVARMEAEHAQHRAALEELERVAARGGDGLAELVEQLARDLRLDMQEEERSLLHEDLLRDDVINIDQSDG
jgi:hypothetical protein